MKPRMDYFRACPEGTQAMRALQAHVNGCGLEHSPFYSGRERPAPAYRPVLRQSPPIRVAF